jgi:hypothetical protein
LGIVRTLVESSNQVVLALPKRQHDLFYPHAILCENHNNVDYAQE